MSEPTRLSVAERLAYAAQQLALSGFEEGEGGVWLKDGSITATLVQTAAVDVPEYRRNPTTDEMEPTPEEFFGDKVMIVYGTI